MKRASKFVLALFCVLALLMTIVPVTDARVSVKGYYRKDGTYVRPHYRSDPDGLKTNNWSYCGNINPYTGAVGTQDCGGGNTIVTEGTTTSSYNAITGTLKLDKGLIGDQKFTVGSTKEDVTKIMGEPQYSGYSSLTYGFSTVYLNGNNQVTGWYQFEKSPLPVSVGDKKNEANPFKEGSTMQQVVDAMGTPTSFNLYMFTYGSSYVFFDYNGLVSSWSEYSTNPLNVEKVQAKADAPPFTVGSTQKQVIDAMGSPDSKMMSSFLYGKSTVTFDFKGNVTGWENKHDKELKVTLGNKDANAQPIEKGFTLQQVVQTMGTPESYNTFMLSYGRATIYMDYFEKVSGWFDYYQELNVKR